MKDLVLLYITSFPLLLALLLSISHIYIILNPISHCKVITLYFISFEKRKEEGKPWFKCHRLSQLLQMLGRFSWVNFLDLLHPQKNLRVATMFSIHIIFTVVLTLQGQAHAAAHFAILDVEPGDLCA